VNVRNEMVAILNSKLVVMGSNQIKKLFCDIFSLIVLVFQFFFSFLYFVFFFCS